MNPTEQADPIVHRFKVRLASKSLEKKQSFGLVVNSWRNWESHRVTVQLKTGGAERGSGYCTISINWEQGRLEKQQQPQPKDQEDMRKSIKKLRKGGKKWKITRLIEIFSRKLTRTFILLCFSAVADRWRQKDDPGRDQMDWEGRTEKGRPAEEGTGLRGNHDHRNQHRTQLIAFPHFLIYLC